MNGFAALMAQSNDVIRDRLSDCTVTIASSAAWPDNAHLGTEPRSDVGDVVVRGMYEEPYDDSFEREGYSPSVSIPTVTDHEVRQWQATFLKHKTRILIDRDAPLNVVRMVHRIERIRHDGSGRTLLELHALGPLCEDVPDGPGGFPYTFPIVFGGATFHKCAQLYV